MGKIKPLAPAEYRCVKCDHGWKENPIRNTSAGPTWRLPGPTQCPACGHKYVVWVNYEEQFGRN